MKLNYLKQENKLFEDKLNFFINYFQYASQKVGRIENIPIETTISLFENIHIQLTDNIKYCHNYLYKYFTNPLIAEHDYRTGKILIKNFNTLVEPYKSLTEEKEKKNWIRKKKKELIDLSLKVIKALKRKFFKDNVDTIITFLSCSHELEEHKSGIKTICNQIISDFLLNDFTKEDLSKIFEFILSNDIEKFPFERSLFFNEQKEYWDELMKNALKTSTFKSRFQAIHNFRFKHTQTAHLLFKVYGLNLKANEVITHKGIKIISSKSNKFKNIRKQEEGFVFNYFENEEKFCIAVLKKTYRSEGFAIKSSLDELNFYIDKINRTTSYFLLVDSNDMFITKDFKEYHGTTRLGEITKAKQYDESEFKKLDFDISDFNLSDEVKEIFLRHQNINDVAVVYKRNPEFWIYLEALHKELIENCDYNKTIKSITSILKSTYYDRLMYRIRFTIWAGLFNNRKIYGFDMTDYNKNRYFESIDVELVKEKTISKFVKDFVSDLTKQPHQLDIESVERFYKNLFLELYELRNHYFHTGNTIRNLEIKMTYTIKYFIDLYIQNILNYSHESKIISPIDQFKSINSNVEKENRKYEN